VEGEILSNSGEKEESKAINSFAKSVKLVDSNLI
jgi:hypothetical protein